MTVTNRLRGEMGLSRSVRTLNPRITLHTISKRVVLRLHREVGHVEGLYTAIEIEDIVLDHGYTCQYSTPFQCFSGAYLDETNERRSMSQRRRVSKSTEVEQHYG
jgi:hypothetical protein